MNIFAHTKSQFATKLIFAREAAGLNGGQVAKKLGKAGHTTISMWENDKALPALDDFVELCKLYNVTPNEILGFDPIYPANSGQLRRYVWKKHSKWIYLTSIQDSNHGEKI